MTGFPFRRRVAGAALAALAAAGAYAASCIVADPAGHAANGGTPLSGDTLSAQAASGIAVDAALAAAGASGTAVAVDAKVADASASNAIDVLSTPPAGFFIIVF